MTVPVKTDPMDPRDEGDSRYHGPYSWMWRMFDTFGDRRSQGGDETTPFVGWMDPHGARARDIIDGFILYTDAAKSLAHQEGFGKGGKYDTRYHQMAEILERMTNPEICKNGCDFSKYASQAVAKCAICDLFPLPGETHIDPALLAEIKAYCAEQKLLKSQPVPVVPIAPPVPPAPPAPAIELGDTDGAQAGAPELSDAKPDSDSDSDSTALVNT